MAEIEKIGGRIIYENRWMKLREDRVRFANGHEGIYSIVDKEDFVLIVPRHADGCFQLVQQFRYPVGARFWEFPQGAWETKPGTNPVDVACGELAEETGFRAGTMKEIGYLYEAYGFSNQGMHVFLATDLVPGNAHRDVEEQGMITGRFSFEEIRGMVTTGEIRDAPTVSALGLLALSGSLENQQR